MELRDKNNKVLKVGQLVEVPDPIFGAPFFDGHTHSFAGTVDSFRNGNVVIADQEDEFIEIEPERLEILEEE